MIDYRELPNPDARELEQIYLLGYDVWGDGAETGAYLSGCRASEKYERGRWHVLNANSRCTRARPPADAIVSALIVYANGFQLPIGFHGIGSVATAPAWRGEGLATRLMAHVVQVLEANGSRGIYLFADIDANFYARLGFVALGNIGAATCMVRLSQPPASAPASAGPTNRAKPTERVRGSLPTYF